MTQGMGSIVYAVRDLERAKRLYARLLGTPPHTDQPWYVGFSAGGLEIGLDPGGEPAGGAAGGVCYWRVTDLEGAIAALAAEGAELRQPPTDVGGGRRIARIADAAGNVTGLMEDR